MGIRRCCDVESTSMDVDSTSQQRRVPSGLRDRVGPSEVGIFCPKSIAEWLSLSHDEIDK